MTEEEESFIEVDSVPLHEITDTSMWISMHIAKGDAHGVEFDVTAGGEGIVVHFHNGESGKLGDRYIVKMENLVVAAVEQMRKKDQ